MCQIRLLLLCYLLLFHLYMSYNLDQPSGVHGKTFDIKTFVSSHFSVIKLMIMRYKDNFQPKNHFE